LVYLPHLDYNLQRLGPDSPHISQDLREIDAIVGRLIDFFEARQVSVILLSEYGITAVDRPVHLNRLFRQQGWLSIKNELRRETLDLGGCRAVAIADHQIAHIVVRDRDLLPAVRSLLADTPGVDAVLDSDERKQAGLDHPRAGDLVAVADARSWFTYYYWNDDAVAPDFARCVDIHRKCGYDPVELFLDPSIRFPKLKIATRLAKKMMGFRMLMDVIPLDASLVKGSHGRVPEDTADWPILIGDLPLASPTIDCTEVYGLLLQHLS